jgi:hypothetical protein
MDVRRSSKPLSVGLPAAARVAEGTRRSSLWPPSRGSDAEPDGSERDSVSLTAALLRSAGFETG